MKIMPAIRTGVLATLVSAAPITKVFSQVASDSTAVKQPFALIQVVAQGGIAKNAPTYALGLQAPKLFTIKTKQDKEILRGNIDFLGILWKKQKYSNNIKENVNVRGSLVSGNLLKSDKVSLKLADVGTYNLGNMEVVEKRTATNPGRSESQLEVSNLLGPVASVKLGERGKFVAMGGLLNSNKQSPTFGFIANLMGSITKKTLVFLKAEKTSSTGSQVNTGILYKL